MLRHSAERRKNISWLTGWALTGAIGAAAVLLADDVIAPKPADAPVADEAFGKEPTEGVYVRDSAGAVEKQLLAQKMERLKEWGKSADLYQEVIAKYADRVVRSQVDKTTGKICQYTSITNAVQDRLAHWPKDGLDVYRARFEPVAQSMIDGAGPDDAVTLNKVFTLYFVTESGKQAGIRLVDLNLERGEYSAAAWVGDRLLKLHPDLGADKPSVMFRTSIAYHFGGDIVRAAAIRDELKAQFAAERGFVRGKDVLLAAALAEELTAPVGAAQSTSADSWPVPFGDNSRGRISSAEGRPGARLYGITLSKPNWNNLQAPQRDASQKNYDESVGEGRTTGIFPVTDRGELFFQDGVRVYAMSLESGVSLPGWSQSYANGYYQLNGVFGSPRGHQLTVALTEHEVLAIMGQPDFSAITMGVPVYGEARLVCLDRATGREKWSTALSQLPEANREIRGLLMNGSPLVVGDSVVVSTRGQKNQFEDSHAIAFNLTDGKVRWSTYLASASAGMNAFNGMAGGISQTDTSSHMAYSNGRIYVQTNLGALAALDAYTGAIAWLNIYPTERANFERQQFNPFGNNASTTHTPRPWAHNPVIVSDGHVFSLPTEGKFVLIYDAASGTEINRIEIDRVRNKVDTINSGAFANIDTLVGINGDKLLLAADRGVIYLDWKHYDKATIDTDDRVILWTNDFFRPLRGRPFLTKDVVFVPCADRLSWLNLNSGKAEQTYPRFADRGMGGEWEDPEEPGNILATNDHVIVAGARSVNVYTDLTLARKKLDKELAALPNDAQPRLRYAEVMFVAGEPDVALSRLNEAFELLGGAKALQRTPVRDRLFADAMNFAEKLAKSHRAEDEPRVTVLYDLAASSAQSPSQQVSYRLSRARHKEVQKDFTAAVQFYQQILTDPALRPVPLPMDTPGSATQAESAAAHAIAAIVKEHPQAYESFEQAASSALDEARQAPVDSASKLLEVARSYPNSTSAGKALIAAAGAYESAGEPRRAIRVLRDMWFKYTDSPEKSRIQAAMARNYLILAGLPTKGVDDRRPIGHVEAAAAALARAAGAGDAELDKPMKLPDGSVIDAGLTAKKALDVLRKYRMEADTRLLPDLHIDAPPVPAPGQKRGRPNPFLPVDAARDSLPNIKSIVAPVADFRRNDRLVVCTSDNTIQIIKAGEVAPTSITQPLGDEPKNCAWAGDRLLVWAGPTLLAAAPGQPQWKLDIHALPQIEVVKLGEPAGSSNVDQVAMNPQQFRIRPGNRIIFRNRPGLGVVAVGAPNANKPAAGVEEVVDVRPVADHVLVTTSAGRLLSLELDSGKLIWQTRLTNRAIDRLVANADFAVVRVTDESAVRLAAFDTATGQLRCQHAWPISNGSAPVNLALAPDGSLVFTTPDRLFIKDLYKPWPDPSDKEIQANAAIFQAANQPSQLLVAEGRILAFAGDGNGAGMGQMRFVRVHSLETGQPVPLRYRAANGEQQIDRVLVTGRSDQVRLAIVGPRLYVIDPQHVNCYNLDEPADSWVTNDKSEDSLTIRDALFSRNYVLAVVEPDSFEAAPDAGIGQNILPKPNADGPQPNGVAAPVKQYQLHLHSRRPVSGGSYESGLFDYLSTIKDPAGFNGSWQIADGSFYYVTADSKLHVLRGSGKQ